MLKKLITQLTCKHKWINTCNWLVDIGRNKIFKFECTKCNKAKYIPIDNKNIGKYLSESILNKGDNENV